MNWGNKLLVTFLVFGAGISFLVYRSMHTNFELVEKDYYKTELKYQQVIDASERVKQLSSSVSIQQTSSGISLQLPTEMRNKKIDGDIWFYCSYDSNKDRRLSLNISDDGSQLFSTGQFAAGNYTVKISWIAEGKNYYSENNLTVLR